MPTYVDTFWCDYDRQRYKIPASEYMRVFWREEGYIDENGNITEKGREHVTPQRLNGTETEEQFRIREKHQSEHLGKHLELCNKADRGYITEEELNKALEALGPMPIE